MNKRMARFVAAVGMAFATSAAWAAQGIPKDLLGRWDITVVLRGQPRPNWLELKEKDGKLVARAVGFWGGICDVKDAKFEDGTLDFTTMFGRYRGKLDGNKLAGDFIGTEDPGMLAVINFKGTHPWSGVKYGYQPDVSGRWDLTLGEGAKAKKMTLVLRAGERGIRGGLLPDGASRQDRKRIENAALMEGVLTFAAEDAKYQVKVRGDGLDGTAKSADGKDAKVTGVRQRDWGQPVELFNGKDLTGWKPLEGDDISNWKAKDGVMYTERPGGNIQTDQRFQDFKLHVEFKVPKDGNSGVYLRGRYEVQVFDSYQKKIEPGCAASVYGRVLPSTNAAKPPTEWQSYEITLIGKYLTVVFNGQTVIDNAEIEGPTGGAIDSNESTPGPIYLQGDHTTIEYRNVKIWPAKTPTGRPDRQG